MTASVTETRIANRALQRVGGQRIGLLNSSDTVWTEDSKNADAIRTCYHILRRAELRRNVWRFSIRRVALRPIDANSKLVTFAAWASGTTYGLNDVITGSDGLVYQSRVAGNVGHDPTSGDSYAYWGLFFGSTIAAEYVGAYDALLTYAKGDHSVGSDNLVYVSLSAGNIGHDPVSDGGVHWGVAANQTPADDTLATGSGVGGTSFYSGELVFTGNKVWYSLQNSNTDAPSGSTKWMNFSAAPTIALPNIVYPIGAGPFSDTTTRNVYQLPNGFLREAPQAPKAGSQMYLGAPSGLGYNDWEYGDNYFVSIISGPIPFRFAADIADPAQFDPMFVEGFASRIGFEICEEVTQSTAKQGACASAYKQFMSEARTVNAIEEGPTEPPEDAYIECRR
jgi:hypothetical protein